MEGGSGAALPSAYAAAVTAGILGTRVHADEAERMKSCSHLEAADIVTDLQRSIHPRERPDWEETLCAMARSADIPELTVELPLRSCGSTASMKMKNVKKLSFAKGHFPKLAECAHFHYENVDFGSIQLSLPEEQNELTRNGCESRELVYLVQISCQGRIWIVNRSYEDFRVLDKHLHLCIYDRRFSQLPELPRSDSLKDSHEVITQMLMAYLSRLSAIADNKINCGPALTWMEIDNKGNHLLVHEESSINVPAIAAAHVIKRYIAQAADELSFEVGDIVSVIDMPPKEDTTWWRGKHGFQVGFFPSECVELINDKVPQSVTNSMPKPVSKKHGKLITFLRSFMKSRPTKQKLKQRGILKERVFGCDLGEHLLNSAYDVPQVLKSCTEFIEKFGIVDGIYRLSGIASNIQKLRHEFDSEQIPDLTKDVYLQDIHCVGSLCKLYFRELPNPLLTYQLYEKFSDAVSAATDDERLVKIHDVIQQLPPPHYRTLEFLMRHLAHLATFSYVTNMHTKNLAIVWAPNLLRSRQIESACFSGTAAFMEVRIQSVVVEFILNHVDVLFSQKLSSVIRDGAGHSSLSRPKSLLVCSPSTKLLSLEEAQARTQAQISSPMTTDSKYIEVGEGPAALQGRFHTIIDFPPERKRPQNKMKKSPVGSWRSFFNLGKSSSVNKRKLQRNPSEPSEMKTIALPGGRGDTGTLRSAKSEESLTSLQNIDGETRLYRPRRPRSSSDALSVAFNGQLLENMNHCNSYDNLPHNESDVDEGLMHVPALMSPRSEEEDLSPPDIGATSLDFDPMSFQCSPPHAEPEHIDTSTSQLDSLASSKDIHFGAKRDMESGSQSHTPDSATSSEPISPVQKMISPFFSPDLSPSEEKQPKVTTFAEKVVHAFSPKLTRKGTKSPPLNISEPVPISLPTRISEMLGGMSTTTFPPSSVKELPGDVENTDKLSSQMMSLLLKTNEMKLSDDFHQEMKNNVFSAETDVREQTADRTIPSSLNKDVHHVPAQPGAVIMDHTQEPLTVSCIPLLPPPPPPKNAARLLALALAESAQQAAVCSQRRQLSQYQDSNFCQSEYSEEKAVVLDWQYPSTSSVAERNIPIITPHVAATQNTPPISSLAIHNSDDHQSTATSYLMSSQCTPVDSRNPSSASLMTTSQHVTVLNQGLMPINQKTDSHHTHRTISSTVTPNNVTAMQCTTQVTTGTVLASQVVSSQHTTLPTPNIMVTSLAASSQHATLPVSVSLDMSHRTSSQHTTMPVLNTITTSHAASSQNTTLPSPISVVTSHVASSHLTTLTTFSTIATSQPASVQHSTLPTVSTMANNHASVSQYISMATSHETSSIQSILHSPCTVASSSAASSQQVILPSTSTLDSSHATSVQHSNLPFPSTLATSTATSGLLLHNILPSVIPSHLTTIHSAPASNAFSSVAASYHSLLPISTTVATSSVTTIHHAPLPTPSSAATNHVAASQVAKVHWSAEVQQPVMGQVPASSTDEPSISKQVRGGLPSQITERHCEPRMAESEAAPVFPSNLSYSGSTCTALTTSAGHTGHQEKPRDIKPPVSQPWTESVPLPHCYSSTPPVPPIRSLESKLAAAAHSSQDAICAFNYHSLHSATPPMPQCPDEAFTPQPPPLPKHPSLQPAYINHSKLEGMPTPSAPENFVHKKQVALPPPAPFHCKPESETHVLYHSKSDQHQLYASRSENSPSMAIRFNTFSTQPRTLSLHLSKPRHSRTDYPFSGNSNLRTSGYSQLESPAYPTIRRVHSLHATPSSVRSVPISRTEVPPDDDNFYYSRTPFQYKGHQTTLPQSDYHVTQLQPYFENGRVHYRYSPYSSPGSSYLSSDGGFYNVDPYGTVRLRQFHSFNARDVSPYINRFQMKNSHPAIPAYLRGGTLGHPLGKEHSFVSRDVPPSDVKQLYMPWDPEEREKYRMQSIKREIRTRQKVKGPVMSQYDNVVPVLQGEMGGLEVIHLRSKSDPGKIGLQVSGEGREGKYLAALKMPDGEDHYYRQSPEMEIDRSQYANVHGEGQIDKPTLPQKQTSNRSRKQQDLNYDSSEHRTHITQISQRQLPESKNGPPYYVVTNPILEYNSKNWQELPEPKGYQGAPGKYQVTVQDSARGNRELRAHELDRATWVRQATGNEIPSRDDYKEAELFVPSIPPPKPERGSSLRVQHHPDTPERDQGSQLTYQTYGNRHSTMTVVSQYDNVEDYHAMPQHQRANFVGSTGVFTASSLPHPHSRAFTTALGQGTFLSTDLSLQRPEAEIRTD
ncbi:rho GTPase-activating protein 32 [Protopterus annectens]|uniref:rho GTPase-activating protein 32 n=1 Tax=Protopterus annectens TaxID=7888 RepID=UPI001CFA22D5|nr:rho GTPase-activating protein 32 [Protopterus annectens]